METNKDVRSNFVSWAGIGFLAFLCIVSTYFQIYSLSCFLFLVLLFALAALLWGQRALKHLKVGLEGKSCRVFPGEEICFSLSIANEKALPLIWLTAELPKPRREFFHPRDGYRQKFIWLLPWQTLIWESACTAERRGVYLLDRLTVSSGDGFGLSVDSRELLLTDSLLFVVYPPVFPVNTNGLMRNTADLRQGNRGYEEDITLLKSSRAYQPGDSRKRINWRVLARQGELTVNLYEQVLPRQATFLLDAKSFTRWKEEETNQGKIQILTEFHEEALEEMISLTASLILAFAEQQIGCALALPGDSKQPGRLLEPERGDGMAPELFTALAGLEYNGQNWLLPQAEVQKANHRLGQLFVLTEAPDCLTCQSLLETLEENRICLLSHAPAQLHPIYRVRDLSSLRRPEQK